MPGCSQHAVERADRVADRVGFNDVRVNLNDPRQPPGSALQLVDHGGGRFSELPASLEEFRSGPVDAFEMFEKTIGDLPDQFVGAGPHPFFGLVEPAPKKLLLGAQPIDLALQLGQLDLKALEDQQVIIEPNSPSPGVTVAFIEVNGAPVELLQIDHTTRPDL